MGRHIAQLACLLHCAALQPHFVQWQPCILLCCCLMHAPANTADPAAAAVPTVWHSNPLAAASPSRQRQQQEQQQGRQQKGQQQQQEQQQSPADHETAGAVSVRAWPADDGGWQWARVESALVAEAASPGEQHQLQLLQGGGCSTGASSPSLRLPASEGSEHQPMLQPQQQGRCQAGRGGSESSCGGGRAQSLSQHWDLPSSPGAGNS